MKFKSIFLTAIAALGLYNATVAQVPNYIPTNGLVSWWPFNGNANDESGNVNNGTVNGASLTTNRFGSLNKAYNFDGVDDVIIVSDNNELRLNTGDFTISLWYKMNSYGLPDRHFIFKSDGPGSTNKWGFQKTAVVNGGPSLLFTTSGALGIYLVNAPVSEDFNWHHAVIVRNGILFNIYEDGILLTSVSNIPMQTSTQAIRIGGDEINGGGHWHHGSLDDIGIWNRALTQQEITALYNGNICYQTITVTDTLLINMGITGFNPITFNNTIKIFPNPTNDHITIDYGNFASLNGYQIKITNSLGQQMFQTPINQQSNYVSLASWGGNGLYFVYIIDPQGNTLDIRKIVLQ
jgi:hypothetical protein